MVNVEFQVVSVAHASALLLVPLPHAAPLPGKAEWAWTAVEVGVVNNPALPLPGNAPSLRKCDLILVKIIPFYTLWTV